MLTERSGVEYLAWRWLILTWPGYLCIEIKVLKYRRNSRLLLGSVLCLLVAQDNWPRYHSKVVCGMGGML